MRGDGSSSAERCSTRGSLAKCEEWAPENPDTQPEVAKADKVTNLDEGGPQGIRGKGKRTKWKGTFKHSEGIK